MKRRDGKPEQVGSPSKKYCAGVTPPTALLLHFFKVILKIILLVTTIQLYLWGYENFGYCISFPERGLSIFPAENLMHPGCTHPGCFPKANCFSKCLSRLLTWYIFKTSPVICYHCNNVFSITKPHQTELSKELCSNFCYSNSPGVHCSFKLSD